ncbi:uncharacterized protein UTRI_10027 [Ustilago trichophora]|uniref:Mig1 protein n=1 Tax=Ustilago trichophora TaxID=86804 RepID=A0A5C3DRN6_9BASI|nr:uncharacterized protein UTRI_10027 [Ustilago trichophora]
MKLILLLVVASAVAADTPLGEPYDYKSLCGEHPTVPPHTYRACIEFNTKTYVGHSGQGPVITNPEHPNQAAIWFAKAGLGIELSLSSNEIVNFVASAEPGCITVDKGPVPKVCEGLPKLTF